MKKKYFILLGAFMLLTFSLVACSGSTGTPQGDTPEKVDSSSSSSSNQTQTFKIGDSIKLGDYVVQVATLENPYNETNEFSQPSAGNKFIAIDVVYTNNTSDKTVSYNVYDWKLFDNNGYNYSTAFGGSKSPGLSSGDLNPGKTVRGWVTFEVPTNSTNYTVQFQPSFWSNDNVEVQLY